MEATMNQLVFVWGSASFTILLVGGITYLYTNGNLRLTIAFMGLGTLITVLASVAQYLHSYLAIHFIGSIDVRTNTPYILYPPGWRLLWQAWPFWLMPGFILSLLISMVGYLGIKRFSYLQPRVEDPAILTQEIKQEEKEIEQLTHTLLVINGKLTRAKVENSQLTKQQLELAQQLENIKKSYEKDITRGQNEKKVLQFELQAKNEMIEAIQKELDSLTEENKQLKVKLKTILA